MSERFICCWVLVRFHCCSVPQTLSVKYLHNWLRKAMGKCKISECVKWLGATKIQKIVHFVNFVLNLRHFFYFRLSTITSFAPSPKVCYENENRKRKCKLNSPRANNHSHRSLLSFRCHRWRFWCVYYK